MHGVFELMIFFKIGALFAASIQTLDALSDWFFAVEVGTKAQKSPSNDLFIAFCICFVFIIVPLSASLWQVYYYSRKHWAISSNKTKQWLLYYSKLLYFTSVLTGSSFTAIELMNSSFFGLEMFEMGLTQRQLIAFKTNRVYSVVLLENFPQLILQTWYILFYEYGSSNNAIAITSAVFSILSIVVSILSMFMERSLIKSQDHTLIEIDVTGKYIAGQENKCKRRVFKIRDALSRMIGVETSLMEMLKVEIIPNGLRLRVEITNKNKKYSDLLESAKRNGSLAQIMFDAWGFLKGCPIITTIQCSDYESHQMQKLNLNDCSAQSVQDDDEKIVDTMRVVTEK